MNPGKPGKLVTNFLVKVKVMILLAWVVCEIVIISKHARESISPTFPKFLKQTAAQLFGLAAVCSDSANIALQGLNCETRLISGLVSECVSVSTQVTSHCQNTHTQTNWLCSHYFLILSGPGSAKYRVNTPKNANLLGSTVMCVSQFDLLS